MADQLNQAVEAARLPLPGDQAALRHQKTMATQSVIKVESDSVQWRPGLPPIKAGKIHVLSEVGPIISIPEGWQAGQPNAFWRDGLIVVKPAAEGAASLHRGRSLTWARAAKQFEQFRVSIHLLEEMEGAGVEMQPCDQFFDRRFSRSATHRYLQSRSRDIYGVWPRNSQRAGRGSWLKKRDEDWASLFSLPKMSASTDKLQNETSAAEEGAVAEHHNYVCNCGAVIHQR